MAQNINEKLPHECKNIAEVRHEIDTIDQEIIRLLSTRFAYVREVVKYKDGTTSGIEAKARRDEVINTRRQWAQEAGLDPDAIGEIYNCLVEYFIEEEKKLVIHN